MPLVLMTALAIVADIADTGAAIHAVETAKEQAMPLADKDATHVRTFATAVLVDAKEIVAAVAPRLLRDDFHYSLGSAELIALPNLSNTNDYG